MWPIDQDSTAFPFYLDVNNGYGTAPEASVFLNGNNGIFKNLDVSLGLLRRSGAVTRYRTEKTGQVPLSFFI
jgi:hypothetical protein